ncbi:hypothetical protein [Chitinophaga solisilvae]|uniref:hypothetical protein n=1 Tax=Chitinophaga solisilvae TaxID=1233460 RepID=UPI00136F56EF|nr:hypothetical protein [Chitinophaga solisilvae]
MAYFLSLAGGIPVADDSDEHFGVPAFTTMNGTLFYDQPKYRIGVKVNNLTNLEY